MSKRYFALVILAVLLLVFPAAYAVPTTGAVLQNTSKNVTFACSSVAPAGAWWVNFGTRSDNLLWSTGNITTSTGGSVNTTYSGLPLMAGTTFYYKCCDVTGCGNTLSVYLARVTSAPTSTYGQELSNLSRNFGDPLSVAGSTAVPYVWATGSLSIVIGVLLLFVFVGLWLRQREVLVPTMIGLLGSGMLIYAGTSNSGVGVPPEFVILSAALVALGLAGVVVGMLKR